jgi:hypothetical protein
MYVAENEVTATVDDAADGIAVRVDRERLERVSTSNVA